MWEKEWMRMNEKVKIKVQMIACLWYLFIWFILCKLIMKIYLTNQVNNWSQMLPRNNKKHRVKMDQYYLRRMNIVKALFHALNPLSTIKP